MELNKKKTYKDGRVNNGGARKNAGRKKGVSEYQVITMTFRIRKDLSKTDFKEEIKQKVKQWK